LKAIFGLGNPGPRYQGTRHNVGFDVVDALARRHDVRTFEHGPAEALIARWRPEGGDAVLLGKPLTFMNLSGQAVGELVRYYKIELPDVLVIFDEAQLPLGKLRARARGSAGGHNGLKSVIAHLGSDVSRLRLGIGRGPLEKGENAENAENAESANTARRDLSDHVLARFDAEERPEVERMILRAADAADTFITDGIAAVMNRFNGGDPATTE
jgi:PTH1 family peptidyl-tRNA hydrolase